MTQISSTCPSSICRYRNIFGYCTLTGPCVMVETKVAIPVKEPEIIRCKDCIFYESGKNEVDSWRLCTRHASNVEPDGYCAWAARKESICPRLRY